MKYHSTRSDQPEVSLSQALAAGLAPDGGLYIATEFPRFGGLAGDTLRAVAEEVLRPFFEGDMLESELSDICDEAFDIPLPLVPMGDASDATQMLELFHGPSSAFKDFGAQMLASCISRIHSRGTDSALRTVLVATSGDTGGAVAAAFHGKPGMEVIILYPRDYVSARQAHQLACWGDNIHTFAVDADFDACQAMVKEAFTDPWWQATKRLTAANSINIGRLLPQTTYYAAASLWYAQEHGEEAGFIIPSGNLGNALACVWAREMGFPIREVCVASNANHSITHWVKTGEFKGFPTVHTLANAMDVGRPSNMERLVHLYKNAPEWFTAFAFDDATIEDTIARAETRWGHTICPHTACAVAARERLDSKHWVLASTAHPAKFETIVEPLVGHEVDVPPALAELLERPTDVRHIEAGLDNLTAALK